MDISGSYRFAAAPAAVWAILTDPVLIAGCLPGCSGLEPIGEGRYRATMTLAAATVSGTYSGTVTMLDQQPPYSYRLAVEGSGKAGFIKGEALVELMADGSGGTTVRVGGRGEVGGLVARVGQRLLGSVSKTMINRFFACMQARI